jgi:hypothetical protein
MTSVAFGKYVYLCDASQFIVAPGVSPATAALKGSATVKAFSKRNTSAAARPQPKTSEETASSPNLRNLRNLWIPFFPSMTPRPENQGISHDLIENKGPLPRKQTDNKPGKGLGMARVADGLWGRKTGMAITVVVCTRKLNRELVRVLGHPGAEPVWQTKELFEKCPVLMHFFRAKS